MKKYVIEGVADSQPCPLCINGDGDGRSKEKRPPVFQVSCEGGFNGMVCAPHLAALIRAASPGSPASAPAAPAAKPEPKPAPLAAALGNGPK